MMCVLLCACGGGGGGSLVASVPLEVLYPLLHKLHSTYYNGWLCQVKTFRFNVHIQKNRQWLNEGASGMCLHQWVLNKSLL